MKSIEKIDVSKIFKYLALSIFVFFIGFYFVSEKENLDIDELYTYGLSNSAFQLQIEDYESYDGNDLLLNYTAVKDNEEFNISNVFFNQKMDTHPPLYYLLVNFICSFHKNSFSMWYGLIINIIFLVILFWEMQYLFSLIIKDKISSIILTIISFFTYGFINEIVFTRMYVMLSVLSMAFIILIINKIKSLNQNTNNSQTNIQPTLNAQTKNNIFPISNNIFFLVLFFINCVFGVLTQYHFAIIAAFFSLIFAIYLIKHKNFKLLILTLIAGLLSLAICYFIFPAMINHILGGDSLHSLTNNQTKSILTNFYEIIATVHQAFFGTIGFYIYIGLFVILIIVNMILFFIHKNSNSNTKQINNHSTNVTNKNNNSINQQLNNNLKTNIGFNCSFNTILYICILICCIYYYIVITLTSTFTFARYLYNIYPLIIIVILSPIYFLLKNIKNWMKWLCILLILILCITSQLIKQPTSLNIGDEYFRQEYLLKTTNENTKTLLLYRSVDENGNRNSMSGTSQWKLPYPIYLLRDMKSMTFVDTSFIRKLQMDYPSISGHNDILLVIYTTQNDQALISEIMKKNNVHNVSKVYFTSYIHIYRLN